MYGWKKTFSPASGSHCSPLCPHNGFRHGKDHYIDNACNQGSQYLNGVEPIVYRKILKLAE